MGSATACVPGLATIACMANDKQQHAEADRIIHKLRKNLARQSVLTPDICHARQGNHQAPWFRIGVLAFLTELPLERANVEQIYSSITVLVRAEARKIRERSRPCQATNERLNVECPKQARLVTIQ